MTDLLYFSGIGLSGLLIAIMLFVFSFHKPVLILKIISVYVLVQYFLSQQVGFLPKRIALIDDFLFYFLFLVIFMKRQELFKFEKKLAFIVILIAMLGFISGRVNGSPLFVTFMGLRGYLQYVMLFFLITNLALDLKGIRKLLLFITDAFLIIQLPMLMYQIIYALVFRYWDPDTAKGTFGVGGTNFLSYTGLIVLFFIIGTVIEEKQATRKNIIRMLAAAFVFIMPQGRYAILLAPFVFLYIYRMKIFTRKSILKGALSVFALLGILFLTFFVVTGFKGIKMYDMYSNFTKWETDLRMGSNRYLWIQLTWEHISRKAFNLFFGLGPGEFWSYISYELERPLTLATFNLWNQLEMGYDAGCATGLTPVMGEFGLAGLALFLSMYYYVLRKAIRHYKKSLDLEIKTLAVPVIAGSILMFFGVYAQLIWEFQNLVFIYWFFTALFFKALTIKKNERLILSNS